ncbi:MAG: glycosyltransferase family 39 protein [Bdellovibrionales bacterium]|nr:glycosyltransferase family 39 protein [Bdellovibrionales bacterium]
MSEHSGAFDRIWRLVESPPRLAGKAFLRWPRLSSLILSILFLYPLLGLVPVYEVSEAREGVVVNEILDSGNLVLPRRNGELVPSKPILFHWIGMLIAESTDGFGAYELRLPSALAATTFLFFFVGFLKSIAGSTVAVLSFLILLFSYGFLQLSQDGRVDMLMLLFADGAILCWLSGYWRERLRGRGAADLTGAYFAAAALLLGFSILAKGPLGCVLALITISAVTVFEEGWDALRELFRPQWLIALLVPLPWYFLAGAQGNSEFFARQVLFENFTRFVGGEGIVHRPFYFYLEHMWSQTLPWLLIVAAVAVVLFVRGRPMLGSLTRAERFVFSSGLLWFFVGVLFLSLSSGKRRAYLLPLLPGYAMASSVFLVDWWRRFVVCDDTGRMYESFSRAALVGGLTAMAVLVCSAIAWVALAIVPESSLNFLNRHFGFEAVATFKAFSRVIEVFPGWLLAASAVLCSAAVMYWLLGALRRSAPSFLFGFLAFTALSFLVLVNLGSAAKGAAHTYKEFAMQVQQQVSKERPLTVVMKKRDESLDGFFFYFRRHVRLKHPGEPLRTPGLYLARRSWLELQPSEWRRSVNEILEGGRAIDKPGERFVLFELTEDDRTAL